MAKINPDLLDQTWKKIDELVDWVKITGKPILGTAIEVADNILGPTGLEYLNDNVIPKVPDHYVDNIERALRAFINDDYDTILLEIPETLDESFDIKQFPDDFEGEWIAVNFEAGLHFIRFYAKKQKELLD